MVLQEHACGPKRIYTGAIEGRSLDGYTAAVVVVEMDRSDKPREIFRDEMISCGHRWETDAEALQAAWVQAMKVTRAMHPA